MFSDMRLGLRSTNVVRRLALLASLLGTIATTAQAQSSAVDLQNVSPNNVSREEMALSPPFCPDAQSYGSGTPGNPSPTQKRWVALMGPDFWHIHHYCWGQIKLQRALRRSTPAQARKFLLESTRSEYYYVILNVAHDFIMLPEIYTRIGEVELRLARPAEAEKAFAKARSLKPDYWPAYSHMAEFLIGAGKKNEAKALIKLGLEYSPASKILREQYRVVGGNPSDIVPRKLAEDTESEGTETSSAPSAEQAKAKDLVTDQSPPAKSEQ